MRLLFLFSALLLGSSIVGAGFALAQRDGQRNWRYFPDMAKSVAYRGQTPNPFLASGQPLLAPVAGTIPRGVQLLAEDPTVHGYVQAGLELHSPFDADHPADMQRARAVFETYCMVCHGPKAEGDGLAVQHGFPRPPSLLFGKALNMEDGHIFHLVTNGFRKMPSYAAQIEPRDRWLAIAYVRSLQENAP
jgi:mono/diheme cytochrome c family protein